MGQNSQSGQIGFGIQSEKGTAVAATRFARIRGGSLGGDRSLLIPDPEIGGNRDIAQAYLGGVGFSGDIDFYPRMQMLAMLLFGVLGARSSSNSAGTNEVQTITIGGTPTGGNYRLRYDGQTTGVIAHDAAASAIDTALEALTKIGAGNVAVTGSAGGPYTVTFGGTLAAENVSQLTVVSAALTGGTAPTVTVTTPTPGVGLVGTHVITGANALPWLTAEERLGEDLESFRYTDVRVNSLRLEAEANGYLMGSANLVALKGESGFTAQTNIPLDETPLVVGSSIFFKFGGNDLRARSFNMEINNAIETDDFRLGSVYLGDAVAKRRGVKMGAAYRPDDATLWKQAMWGGSSFTEAQPGAAYRGPVDIEISTFETIGNVVGGTKYSATLSIPEAVIAPFKISPQGDDVIGTDIELTALRPIAAVPIVTAIVVNDLATIS